MKTLAWALGLLLLTGMTVLAAPIQYAASLNGLNEAPPNASPGTGDATVIIDTAAHTLYVGSSFSDLIGITTAAHIHCCTAVPLTGTIGVASTTPSFPGFPLGVTSGVFSNTFDLTLASSFSAGFIAGNGGTPAGAEAALAAGLADGRAYFNIHSSAFPGGEIRGFLVPVPEPSSLLLAGPALFAFLLRRRR